MSKDLLYCKDLLNRTLTRSLLFVLAQLDSYVLNVQQNHFNKVYRAKHALSEVEGTPSTQRKTRTYIPNLGALCAFARDTVFPISFSIQNFKYLWLVFCLISLLQAIPLVEAAGPLSVKTTNPRFFDPKGKSVYLTGSYMSEYNLLSGSSDFASHLDFLQQQKQNFTRVWGWEQSPWIYDNTGQVTFSTQPYERTGPGLALDGGLKFDLTRFNPAYFDQIRSRVVQAARRGVYVSVVLFEGFSTQKKMGRVNPWLSDPFQQVNNISGVNGDPNRNGGDEEFFSLAFPPMLALQEAFVRKVVDTLNDLDNVLYEVSGNDLSGSLSWQYHMIDYIKSYQATKRNQHPVGISQFAVERTGEVFKSSADWIVIQESNLNSPLATSNKVLIMEGSPVSGGNQALSTSPISLFQLLPDSVVSSQSPGISNNVPSSNGVTLLSSSATSSTLNTTKSSPNQQSKVATPTITPNGGVYSGTVAVTLQTTTPAASIYYTTDGQSPTQSSRLYTGKFTLSNSTLIKAKAFKSNFDPSSEASAWFANAVSPAVAGSSLVAYWKFDEGSGTTTADSSGNGNTGTLVNGPLWTAGRVGNALFFDGIDDNVTVPDSASLHLSSSFTLSAWVNPTVAQSDFTTAIAKNTASDHVYFLYATSGAGYCGYSGFPLAGANLSGAQKVICNSSGLPLNTWNYLTFTYDGSNFQFYVNGSLRQTVPFTGTIDPSTGTLQIGASHFGEYFKGFIDEVRIYSRALSDTEIQSIYQQESVVTSQTVATPVISPNGGNYSGSVSVTMQTATSGAAIYYTTNGSTPTQSSTLYTGAMNLTSSATVKAKAFKSGSNQSAEASASFTVTQPFNFSIANSGDKSVIAGSSVTNSISTTLSSGSAQAVAFSVSGLPSGATASFSSTGCSPACSSTLSINTSGSTPAGSSTITVSASGGGVTKTTTFTLTVNLPTVATPTITPNGGNFTSSVSVTMQTATSGAAIYYTTNGSTPTTSSTLYTAAMNLTSSATVKAKAFKSGSNGSAEATASFTVTQPFSFTLANSGDRSVNAGSSVTNSISTTLSSGTSQAVSFSVSGLPSGATASFSSTGCSPACSSTLTINTSSSTLAASSNITVTAAGGGVTKTTTFSLTVSLPTVATPTISPNGGTFTGSVAVTLQSATSGASIYFTTNGSSPTQSSMLYTGAMTLTSSTVVKAKAFKSGSNGSAEASASFTVSQGLVAYWKFDEGSGTTTADSSGNGNTGTLVNGPLWTAGRVGNALFFDGIDDNVTVPDSASLHLSSSFTLSAWVNPTVAQSDFTTAIAKNTASDHVYFLYATSGAGYCGYSGFPLAGANLSGAQKVICNSSGLPLNTWNYLTFTYDGSNFQFYVNGSLRQTVPFTGTIDPSTGTLQIGASHFGEYFKGFIDEVRIYSRALSDTEIQSIYQQESVVTSQTVATPVISPNGGNYSGSVSVTMQTATSGAAIYYTTNGSTPTQSSTLYTGAMNLTSSATVKAKAFKSGSNGSAEASASFTVTQPFNFSLANSGDKSVIAGSSVTNSIAATLVSGSSQAVSFSIAGLPSGATGSFSSISCNPACSTVLSVNTTGSTPAGNFPITVTSTGGSVTKTTAFTLSVTLALNVATATITPASGTGNTYYVATNGSDSNSGTISQPFRTIKTGISVTKAGDTLYIRGGTYNEVIDNRNQTVNSGTSWSNVVTIKNYGNTGSYGSGETVIMNGSGEAIVHLGGGGGAQVPVAMYVAIDGLRIDATNALYGFLPGIFTRLINADICCWNKGLSLSSARVAGVGIMVGPGSHDNEIINTVIHDGTYIGNPSDGGSHGIYQQGSNNVYDRLHIYNVGQYGIQFYPTQNANNNIVRNSIIHDTGKASGVGGGPIIAFGSGNQIHHNIFYNNKFGISLNGSGNHAVYNNTIYSSANWGIQGTSSNNIVEKNILIQNNPNVYTVDGLSATYSLNLCDINGTGCAIVADPLFVDAANGNFSLQNGSPAIGAGTYSIMVNSTPDIGAY